LFLFLLDFFKQLHLYQTKLSRGNTGNTNSPGGYLIRLERKICTALRQLCSADLSQGLRPSGTSSLERLGKQGTSGTWSIF